MSDLQKLVGLHVVQVVERPASWKYGAIACLLFSDRNTIMEIHELDSYGDDNARTVEIFQNAPYWTQLSVERHD